VAAVPGGIAVAYDHIDADAASVPRVFTRIFGNVARRRAAR